MACLISPPPRSPAKSNSCPSNPWSLLPELLRSAFASLALAIGFAGLARRGRSGFSLLAELQLGWQRLRYRKVSLRRGSRHGDTSETDYIPQLIGEED
jgi:hypothetical protein